MIELLTAISLVSAVLSVALIKHRVSEFFVTVTIILSVIPVVDRLSPLVAVSLLALILCFDIAALNDELWNKKRFKEISRSRMRLVLVGLCFTLGASGTLWWWQDLVTKKITFNGENFVWWKLMLVLALALHIASLSREQKESGVSKHE